MTTRVDDELLAGFEDADAERAAKIAELEEKLREREAVPAIVESPAVATSLPESDVRTLFSNLGLHLGLGADVEPVAVDLAVKQLFDFREAASKFFPDDDDIAFTLKVMGSASKIRDALLTIFGHDEIGDPEFDPESFFRKRAEVFDKVVEELGIDSTEDVTTDDLVDKIDMLGSIQTAVGEAFECKPDEIVDKIEEFKSAREGMKLFLPSLNDLLNHLEKFYPPRYVPPSDDAALTVLFEEFFNTARSADIDWD